MMEAATKLSATVGVKASCSSLNLPRATYYRHQDPEPRPAKPRPRPPLALKAEEREAVVEVLHSPRFADRSPHQIWAVLLDDEKLVLCSVRTMYRILEAEGELRERRNQLRRPAYAKPELVATAPNQVWTWDITKLKGPVKWTYYYLYVILDLYSRLVVGWMVAPRESAKLAERLVTDSLDRQGISRDQVTLHADRGPSQTAKSLALLLADLGVRKSHNRPYTSNDNPFSEAQFKTMKYHPSFPDRFGSLAVSLRQACVEPIYSTIATMVGGARRDATLAIGGREASLALTQGASHWRRLDAIDGAGTYAPRSGDRWVARFIGRAYLPPRIARLRPPGRLRAEQPPPRLPQRPFGSSRASNPGGCAAALQGASEAR